MPYRLKFDKEKCIGCYACHIACLDAHHSVGEIVPSFRAFQKVTDLSGTFEKTVCPGCIHCGKCEHVCPQHAIYREKTTGFILVDRDLCNGCRSCEAVCPLQVIHFNEEGKMEKCDGCVERIKEGREPACVRTCYPGAITWEKVDG